MTKLLCVEVDGTTRDIDAGYESLREAIGDVITYVFVDARLGVYVSDNGLITRQPLNPAASMIAGMALYGVAVLCSGHPDDQGDSVPLATRDRKGMGEVADRWRQVVASATAMGQEVLVYPNPDTVPPPRIVALPDSWLPGDAIPEGG